jgi:hypothetical protein
MRVKFINNEIDKVLTGFFTTPDETTYIIKSDYEWLIVHPVETDRYDIKLSSGKFITPHVGLFEKEGIVMEDGVAAVLWKAYKKYGFVEHKIGV